MTEKTTYFGKDTTKFSHELCHILDEVAHRCPSVSRLRQFSSDIVGPVDSLAGPELGFGLVAETSPDSLPLNLFWGWILWWSAKWGAHNLYVVLLKFLAVVPVEVNLIPEETFWLCTETLFKKVYVHREIQCLIVGLPTVMVDERVAVDDAEPIFAPNSTFAFALPRTIGRTCGWWMLTILFGHVRTPWRSMYSC